MSARPNLALVPAPAPPFEGFDGEFSRDNQNRIMAELQAERETITGLQKTIQMQAGRMTRLEKALEEADPSQHPEYNEIRSVVDRWRRATGHKNAKLSKDRLDLVKARRKDEYSFEHLELAVDGIGAFPFVTANGRASTGQPNQRHDRLGIAFEGGESVERFAVLGHRARQQGLVTW